MILYVVTVALIDAVLGLITRRTHLGLDRIPRAGPIIVVSNHLSVSDPLVLGCALLRAGRRATFLAKAEVFTWPVVGAAMRVTGQIPVSHTTDPSGALQPALAALARGSVVAMYPEGRVTTEPDYRPMAEARTGAVRLALAAGCPIVPIAQWGAHHLLSREHTSSLTRPLRFLGRLRRDRVPRRPTVTVLIGDPIEVHELQASCGPDGNLRAGTQLVMDRIRALVTHIAD
jgi:1-acyl-sn-glycerol-3-phosphate acyltransferase